MMTFYNENSSEINEKAFDLEREVTRIIHQIGVPAHIKGYQYLRMAIMLVVEDCDRVNSLSKHIYPDVAEKYQTTTSRVEYAIRKAIDIVWDRGDVDILNSYFGYNRGRPTPTEFIAMIADHLTVKESDDPMVTNVTKILHQCGVPADIKGYNYLRTAILLTVKDSDIIDSATKRLYPSVAWEYGTTTSRVEAAIRNEFCWRRSAAIVCYCVSEVGIKDVHVTSVPCNINCLANGSFNAAGCGNIFPCHRGIEPLCCRINNVAILDCK